MIGAVTGIGSAFWGLLVGALVLVVTTWRPTRRREPEELSSQPGAH